MNTPLIRGLAKVAIGEMDINSLLDDEKEKFTPSQQEMAHELSSLLERDVESRKQLKMIFEEALVIYEQRRKKAIRIKNSEDEKQFDDLIEMVRFNISLINTIL